MAAISTYYENVAKILLKMAVPSEIANQHLIFINTCMKLSKNVNALGSAFTDPFIATVNFNDYTNNIATFSLTSALINQYLTKNGIYSQQ